MSSSIVVLFGPKFLNMGWQMSTLKQLFIVTDNELMYHYLWNKQHAWRLEGILEEFIGIICV